MCQYIGRRAIRTKESSPDVSAEPERHELSSSNTHIACMSSWYPEIISQHVYGLKLAELQYSLPLCGMVRRDEAVLFFIVFRTEQNHQDALALNVASPLQPQCTQPALRRLQMRHELRKGRIRKKKLGRETGS
jgi:hypothetical protein